MMRPEPVKSNIRAGAGASKPIYGGAGASVKKSTGSPTLNKIDIMH